MGLKVQVRMVNLLHLVPHADQLLEEVSEHEKHAKLSLINEEIPLTLMRQYFDLIGFQGHTLSKR